MVPASAIPGWPTDVQLPPDPIWKRDYAASVRRLVRDGVDAPLAHLFLEAAGPVPRTVDDADGPEVPARRFSIDVWRVCRRHEDDFR